MLIFPVNGYPLTMGSAHFFLQLPQTEFVFSRTFKLRYIRLVATSFEHLQFHWLNLHRLQNRGRLKG